MRWDSLTVDQTFADAAPNVVANSMDDINSYDIPDSPSSFQMSDSVDGSDVGRATRLPDVGMTAGTAVSVDPSRDYPTTGPAFSLPDPATAVTAARSEIADNNSSSFEVPAMTGNPTTSNASPSTADVASAGLANAIATGRSSVRI